MTSISSSVDASYICGGFLRAWFRPTHASVPVHRELLHSPVNRFGELAWYGMVGVTQSERNFSTRALEVSFSVSKSSTAIWWQGGRWLAYDEGGRGARYEKGARICRGWMGVKFCQQGDFVAGVTSGSSCVCCFAFTSKPLSLGHRHVCRPALTYVPLLSVVGERNV